MSFRHSNVIPSFRNHSMSCKTEILWSVIPGSFLAGMTLEWHIYQFEVIPRWNDLEWQLPSSHWNDRDGLGMTGLGPEWRDEEASEEVIRISIPVILAPSRHSGVIRECSFNGDEPRMTAGWVRPRDQSSLLSLSCWYTGSTLEYRTPIQVEMFAFLLTNSLSSLGRSFKTYMW